MTLDLGADANRNVFYLNFENIGDFDDDGKTGEQFCDAEQNFNFDSLIDNAGDWLLSIERLRLPLQGIPMFSGNSPDWDKGEPAIRVLTSGSEDVVSSLFLPDIYSLNEFLTCRTSDQ